MNTTTDDRDRAVRALLVTTATQSKRRGWRSSALIGVVAFLLGGGLATGAVTAALAATKSPVDFAANGPMFDQALFGGHVLGQVVSYRGSADAHLDLGARPEGATGIIYTLTCGEKTGRVLSVEMGGVDSAGAFTCKMGTGFGSHTERQPTNSLVTVKTDGTFEYVIWGQWYAAAPPVEPSDAQKAAIADGRITSAELHAAADRVAACMTGAGYTPTITTYEPEPIFNYAPGQQVPSGVIYRCETAELSKISAIWYAQGEHE